MRLANIWKLWKKNRRLSFYESQHVMRRAAETAGPVDISWLSDEALMRIVEGEPGTIRAEAAHYCLEQRARERLASAVSGADAQPLRN